MHLAVEPAREQHVRPAEYRRERRAELVRDRREELVLQAVRLLRLFARGLLAGQRLRARVDLRLQLGLAGDALGHVFDDCQSPYHAAVVGDERRDARGLLHLRKAAHARVGRQRQEVSVKALREYARLPFEHPLVVTVEPARLQPRVEFEQMPPDDLRRDAPAVLFEPAVPRAYLQPGVRDEDALPREVVYPMQQPRVEHRLFVLTGFGHGDNVPAPRSALRAAPASLPKPRPRASGGRAT